ncbi:MAG: cysteine hydrolase [Actinobacteria bacterium]|nr:cysteine hydrolase [Actinomycetota bacterium]
MTGYPPGGEHSGTGLHATYRARDDASLAFPPDRSVLLVIDPVNDFLSEGGAGWEMTKGTVKKNDVVANLARAIDAARGHGIPVLFGPMAYTAEDYADEGLQRRSGINRIMFEQKMFLAGSWGAAFHPDLRPGDDEVVLLPHKGTDVFETDLPEHLGRLGTTHLVIAGMTANLCCESTGRHAAEHGYDVTFLSDAIGAENLAAYEASVRVNYPLIANAVLTVEEFLAALADAGQTVAVQPGDTVVGSDRGEIGTVEEVVPPSDGAPGYMLVPRGVLFEKDTFIPLDAVVKRAGRRVFVNVPKLVAGKMPWGEPPGAATWEEKLGPPAASVAELYADRSPSVLGSPGRR